MKTTIYIDGFNLYYSALKGTPYKWLDVVALFSQICHTQNPEACVECVKFFTAPVRGKIATRGEQAVHSQAIYHKALKTRHPDTFRIIEGFFMVESAHLPKYQNPIDKTDRVEVWRMEEKKTDVNIALNLYRDAAAGMEQVVLVSNDSDLVPAIEAVKADFPVVTVGTIAPQLKTEEGQARASNKELADLSDWVRHYMREEELQSALLPEVIPTRKKAVFKPDYW